MFTHPLLLQQRRILITGAARGLGEAFARSCVAAGARVVIADIEAERGAALAAELGHAAQFVLMNVGHRASVEEGLQKAVQWLGGLDGLINNAAITNSGGKMMNEMEEEMFDRVMQVNIKGVWLVTNAAHPHLRAAAASGGAASVLNIASDTALWGAPRLIAYVASKGAVISMTRSMARELGQDAISVNAIAPGLVVGESTEYVPQARHDQYLQGRAIKREQQSSDCTDAALFLLSGGAGFVTGQVLNVNGGYVMN
jgi:NAD(P)-dependent dehydrogenase (short-subunit alcohol dehydrogenase family)